MTSAPSVLLPKSSVIFALIDFSYSKIIKSLRPDHISKPMTNFDGYNVDKYEAAGAQDAWSRAVGIERDKEHFYKCLNKVRALLEEYVETHNFREP